ncbi:unnamed protein product [Vitrella brassicaformis CCMP3155]|uniref:ER membrane protein complex subunit 1 n=2 Tax=Vitrella brassicaformis TaxID=1169539 RepID=A0A0G4GHV5_VITBC|nr:unnamed protein product [Vitrella brassicaformis CCMP3155]|eukprot:CEM29319.1 unnamed protein product [Vitrella brassicaformis CCMP3155]
MSHPTLTLFTRLAALWSILFLLSLPRVTHALYEDEAGERDWLIQTVGRVTHLVTSPLPTHSRRLYVGTAQGIVAALQTKTGALEWRREGKDEGERVSRLAIGKAILVSLSVNDGHEDGGGRSSTSVRCWHVHNGDLLWQETITQDSQQSDGERPAALVDVAIVPSDGGGGEAVLLATERGAQLRHATSGRILRDWATSASHGSVRYSRVIPLDDQDGDAISFALIGRDISSSSLVASIHKTVDDSRQQPSGKPTTLGKVTMTPVGEEQNVVQVAGTLVGWVESEGTIKAVDMKEDGRGTSYSHSVGGGGGRVRFLGERGAVDGVLTLADSRRSYALIKGTEGRLNNIWSKEGRWALAPFYATNTREPSTTLLGGVLIGHEKTHVEKIDLTTGGTEPVLEDSSLRNTERGPAMVALVRESSSDVRVSVSCADHSLALIRQAGVSWIREEALGSVKASSFYHLPPSLLSYLMRSPTTPHASPEMEEAQEEAEILAEPLPLFSLILSLLSPGTASTPSPLSRLWANLMLTCDYVLASVGLIVGSLGELVDVRRWQGKDQMAVRRQTEGRSPLLVGVGVGGGGGGGGDMSVGMGARERLREAMLTARKGHIGHHRFGDSDVIVLATCAGKVYGLHASSGRILWHKTVWDITSAVLHHHPPPECRPRARLHTTNTQLTESLSNSHNLQDGPITLLKPLSRRWPEVLICAHTAFPLQPSPSLLWLDTLTGHTRRQVHVSPDADVLPLALPGHATHMAASVKGGGDRAGGGGGLEGWEMELHGDVDPVMVVERNGTVALYPPSPKLVEWLPEMFSYYRVQTNESIITGFGVDRTDGSLRVVPRWQTNFAAAKKYIAGVASSLHRNFEHVPVQVKGDVTVLYRYLNPNLLAVVTTDAPPPQWDAYTYNAQAAAMDFRLTLHLIDGVTGAMLLSETLPIGAALPVHMAVCDNWVAVHYFNALDSHHSMVPRFEMHVVELFDPQRDTGPLGILLGDGWATGPSTGESSTPPAAVQPTVTHRLPHTVVREMRTAVSAHSLPSPTAFNATFIFPSGIRLMGVTATQRGVTTRIVLLGLSSGHIYGASKNVLNARRPVVAPPRAGSKPKKLSAAEREEGIPPYAPTLPITHTDMLSYYQQVCHLRGISTYPTELESTSLLFAYGLDLFFAPVQPAKGFDVLSSTFNYPLLSVSLLAITAAVIVTTALAHRKRIYDRWK